MVFLSQCVTAFNLMMLFRNSLYCFPGQNILTIYEGKIQKTNNQFSVKREIIVVADYKLRLHSQGRRGRALAGLETVRRKRLLSSGAEHRVRSPGVETCFCCPGT